MNLTEQYMTESTGLLCIYHGNCADGFGAAWAVRHALGEHFTEFYPGVYQTPPPDADGRDVLLVDFSYKADAMLELAATARTVTVLDHHKSAREDLAPFVDVLGVQEPLVEFLARCDKHKRPPVRALFDMDRSGAMLAWDAFFPGREPPALLKHIQDRDLWRFELDGTEEIQAALFSYSYDFDLWDSLMAMGPAALRDEGIGIRRKHYKDVHELINQMERTMEIGGYSVPVANLPYTMASDAGHIMAQGRPFSACYFDKPDCRYFSLRSAEGGVDVSEIAKQYGGGGHRDSAGFTVPRDHDLAKA
ncbi:MAG TPA: phosphohydrolase [Gammaproteobacteria bacterium]|nr:phosphohydrolase [Gammaproteobacteria bacterium]